MTDQIVPAHVPTKLVVDADIFDLPGADVDPQLGVEGFRSGARSRVDTA